VDFTGASLRVPRGRVENLRLPAGRAGSGEALEVNFTLDNWSLELEQDGESDADWLFSPGALAGGAEPGLFDNGGPLSVRFPGFESRLGLESGAAWRTPEPVHLTYAGAGVAQLLAGMSEHSGTPWNGRTAPSHEERPHARKPAILRLGSFLKELHLKASASFVSVAGGTDGQERTRLSLQADAEAHVSVDAPFAAGASDYYDEDLGYLHLVVPGLYGRVGTRSPAFGPARAARRAPAIVRLSCGMLELHKVDGSRGASPRDRPFGAGAPWVTLDLADAPLLRERRTEGGSRCFMMRRGKGLPGSMHDKFFCAAGVLGTQLEAAIDLQVTRLQDARQRTASQTAERWEQQGIFSFPDGTWFRKQLLWNASTWFPEFVAKAGDPVLSPAEQWRRALPQLADEGTPV